MSKVSYYTEEGLKNLKDVNETNHTACSFTPDSGLLR